MRSRLRECLPHRSARSPPALLLPALAFAVLWLFVYAKAGRFTPPRPLERLPRQPAPALAPEGRPAAEDGVFH